MSTPAYMAPFGGRRHAAAVPVDDLEQPHSDLESVASSGESDASSEARSSSSLKGHIRLLEDRLRRLEEKDEWESQSYWDERERRPSKFRHATKDTITTYTAKVRWCNWEEFKNRYEEEECCFAIEALVSGSQLDEEIKQEAARRDKPSGRVSRSRTLHPDNPDGLSAPSRSFSMDTEGHGINQISPAIDPMLDNSRWIQRVRIQSKSVLKVLGHIAGEEGFDFRDQEEPTTFLQPFKMLILFHPRMKAELELMEEVADISLPTAAQTKKEPRKVVLKNFKTTDVDELRCYVDFVDKYLMRHHELLRSSPVSPDCPKKLRWADLWHLFKPGELIYLHSFFYGLPDVPTSQRVWRVFRVERLTRAQANETFGRRDRYENEELESKAYPYASVHCHHLDFDGKEFVPVPGNFAVPWYSGEMDITSLALYPLRFRPDWESTLAAIKLERKNFCSYVNDQRHLFYDGWTVLHDPIGSLLRNKEDQPIKHRHYINSEVIVDFEEAFQSHTTWKPRFGSVKNYIPTPTARWTIDPVQVIHWDSRRREKVITRFTEQYEEESVMGALDYKPAVPDRFVELVIANTGHASSMPSTPITRLTDDELVLVPLRLLAYAFSERKFFQLDIRSLRPIDIGTRANPFDHLQINPEDKTMIKSLIHSHIHQRKLDQLAGPAVPSQDLIRGKGRGLVILLHGAPGVGKTATVESVAQLYKKPLFAITSGDLGLNATAIESSMTEIFRLAHLWDCILLLDEADVFLSQRRPNDLERNALVSVILRILEYYNGILFLTTNRPGTLDEAVKSRVHMSLHYPPLSKDQTEMIFRMNMERLKLIEATRSKISKEDEALAVAEDEILRFAMKHYDTYGGTGVGSWNGRQIRNAFQIAASLAHYDHVLMPNLQPQLRASHFESVAATTLKYDEYRAQTLGHDDEELARQRDDREDTTSTKAWTMAPHGIGAGPSTSLGHYRPYAQQPSQSQPYSGAMMGYPSSGRGQAHFPQRQPHMEGSVFLRSPGGGHGPSSGGPSM